MKSAISKSLQVSVKDIENLKEIKFNLITFTVAGKSYWAQLTLTGRVKKNSIRRDN